MDDRYPECPLCQEHHAPDGACPAMAKRLPPKPVVEEEEAMFVGYAEDAPQPDHQPPVAPIVPCPHCGLPNKADHKGSCPRVLAYEIDPGTGKVCRIEYDPEWIPPQIENLLDIEVDAALMAELEPDFPVEDDDSSQKASG